MERARQAYNNAMDAAINAANALEDAMAAVGARKDNHAEAWDAKEACITANHPNQKQPGSGPSKTPQALNTQTQSLEDEMQQLDLSGVVQRAMEMAGVAMSDAEEAEEAVDEAEEEVDKLQDDIDDEEEERAPDELFE